MFGAPEVEPPPVSTPPTGGAWVVAVAAAEVVVVAGAVVVVSGVAVVVVVSSGVVQTARVMVLVFIVTVPLRASTLPSTVAPVVRVIEVNARMFPTKELFVPRVAELPTCQNTLQASAPLMRLTLLAVAVSRVLSIWKMKTALGSPSASRVSGSVVIPKVPDSES